MSLTGKEVAQMHKDYVMQSWARSGADILPVERAEGIYFYDYDGKKYADMASLLVCSNLGHELPEIVEAIRLIRCASWHRHMHPSLRACWQKCL
mgnify:CR=1 FL=1